jgi:N-acetylmuramoyl-L-alanine amidase
MESTSSSPNPSLSPVSKPYRGLFYQLQVVIGVALVLATLFTAWTPGTYAQPGKEEPLALEPAPKQTSQLSEGSTTPTQPLSSVIGIVSGHWGNDSGAVCSDGLTEADVNLTIATLVQKNLVKEGYEVDLLKEFDPRLEGYKALALISIHNDSCEYINDQATGFKVASTWVNPHPERSARLASCLRNRYYQATGLGVHSTSVTSDMTSYHGFGEIDENTPAVIIETGFLNLDRQVLTQQPDKVALGITNGVLCFLRNESISVPSQPTPESTIIQPTSQVTSTLQTTAYPTP